MKINPTQIASLLSDPTGEITTYLAAYAVSLHCDNIELNVEEEKDLLQEVCLKLLELQNPVNDSTLQKVVEDIINKPTDEASVCEYQSHIEEFIDHKTDIFSIVSSTDWLWKE